MRLSLPDLYDARVTAGGLAPDPAQRAVAQRLETLRSTLEAAPPPPKRGLLSGVFGGPARPEAPRGVYLWGGVGRGKSMLMDLFQHATAIPAKRRVHFHAFMQEVHRGLHAARLRNTEDALAPVAAELTRDLRLLCLDEMQISDITDAMIVGRLFEALLAAGVAIVTTSNRPPEDLYLHGLNRQSFLPFIALIRRRLDVVELVAAGDYRQNRLAGAESWFQPADARARTAIDTLWAELTAAAPPEPLTLTVQGRAVVIPAFAGGVARASFWDLCGRPHGPADYLALADTIRLLMLEEIPRLDARNYNEAKRFVTLIDALYEARVRLIASAADRPEALYLEGEGSFEFSRTASRLREMQSADWGA